MDDVRTILAEAVSDLAPTPDDSGPVVRRARRRRRRKAAITIITALAVATSGIAIGVNALTPARRPSPPGAEACATGWQETEVPSPGNYGSSLRGVVAFSASDAWAVGGYGMVDPAYLARTLPPGSHGGPAPEVSVTPLVLHWDGNRWNRVDVPNRGGVSLTDVAAAAPDDIWAVGRGGNYPVIEHWDGEAWSVVESPQLIDFVDQTLSAVTAAGPEDAWAVGSGGPDGVVIERWDGRTWSLAEIPKVDQRYSALDDIDAVAPDDAWAVGNSWDRPLILHWDGTTWSDIESPNVPNSRIQSVEALAHDDAWAVGATFGDINGSNPMKPFLEHWDGTRWSLVSEADLPHLLRNAGLADVTAAGPDDVWVRGSQSDTDSWRPLILHFDGSTWTEISAPGDPATGYGAGIAATHDSVWLVGSVDSPEGRGSTFATRRCAP